MSDEGLGPLSADIPWAIDVRGLTKRYGGRAVVDHVDLRVAPGRICGFLGPNGSGKTTTIRMLCGLLKPDEGEGTCLGLDVIRQSRRIKLQAGYSLRLDCRSEADRGTEGSEHRQQIQRKTGNRGGHAHKTRTGGNCRSPGCYG